MDADATPTGTSDLTAEDERAIADLLQRLADGWKEGDGDAFAEPFAENADYVVATGDRLDGRREIADVHRRLFDGIFDGTRLWDRPGEMRYLAPDVVLIRSEGAVLFPGEADGSVESNGLTTTICTRHDGEWRIDSFQNTPTGKLRTPRFLWRYLVSQVRRRA